MALIEKHTIDKLEGKLAVWGSRDSTDIKMNMKFNASKSKTTFCLAIKPERESVPRKGYKERCHASSHDEFDQGSQSQHSLC